MARSTKSTCPKPTPNRYGATFHPWLSAARRTGRSTRGRKLVAASAPKKQNNAEIRTWARENGHKVSARGRVSAELVTAYERATA
uniref:Lsr2 family DNA-binding protein n=1 Tax=Nocardia aurea TaxID=2144174 RepID=UPI0038CD7842